MDRSGTATRLCKITSYTKIKAREMFIFIYLGASDQQVESRDLSPETRLQRLVSRDSSPETRLQSFSRVCVSQLNNSAASDPPPGSGEGGGGCSTQRQEVTCDLCRGHVIMFTSPVCQHFFTRDPPPPPTPSDSVEDPLLCSHCSWI